MPIIHQARLKQYLKLNYNVLFVGLHGVGKTAVIKQVFDEEKLRWLYFSASTLDPWVDFVGVPKVREGVNGPKLELIRPDYLDDVEALFFDEFNRAPDKVINAVMELIQFKSINGHKLPKLRVIWAAINPDDEADTYTVGKLDPAHLDRFQVKIDVPFQVDKDYFLNKYPKIGGAFIDWWKELPDDIQKHVSPRRLDYAAHAFENDCRIEDLLPKESNVGKLRSLLKSLPFQEAIASISTLEEARRFLNDGNNATKLLELVKVKDKNTTEFFVKYGEELPKELVAPYEEFVAAYRDGADSITTLKMLIEASAKLDPTRVPGLINHVDFSRMFSSATSIVQELNTMNSSEPQLLRTLANRIADAFTRVRPEFLDRAMWGMTGKAGNDPTLFQQLTQLINMVDTTLFSPTQKSTINSRLYRAKIIDTEEFIK